MSKLLVIATISVIIALIVLIYKEGESKGKNKEVIKQQEVDIKIKNEIIEDTKQIYKRKQIDKTKPTGVIKNDKVDWTNANTNLGWLYQNRNKNRQSR